MPVRAKQRQSLREVLARDGAAAAVAAPPDFPGQLKVDLSVLIREHFPDQGVHYDVDPNHFVTLTPGNPNVAGRGELSFLVPRGVTCGDDGGNAWWLAQDTEKLGQDGHVEIWLEGLDPDKVYVGAIEVGAIPAGDGQEYRVRTSFGWSDVPVQAGIGQAIPILMDTPHDELALIRIEASDLSWSFYSAEFKAF